MTVASQQYFTGYRVTPDPLDEYLYDTGDPEFEGIKRLSIDPDNVVADDFTLPQHQSMYQFWLDNKDSADLPPSTAIDPLAFPKALGNIHVVQPNADLTDFYYRVYATAVAEIGRRDMTGKWFSEFKIANWVFYRRQLEAAAKMRRPIYSENNADYDISVVIKWSRLLLPMVDENGAVNRILVAIVGVNRNA